MNPKTCLRVVRGINRYEGVGDSMSTQKFRQSRTDAASDHICQMGSRRSVEIQSLLNELGGLDELALNRESRQVTTVSGSLYINPTAYGADWLELDGDMEVDVYTFGDSILITRGGDSNV
ncbi:hypothetical protein G3A49_15800 [Haloferax volcanii]|uniref:Uncharacterized protein n=3 Tax=Haloferax TaxID=2251 RepID=A0A6C0UWF6_HALVO|nr:MULTISPECIES: hypothetical protein [Haloferax]NLV04092.1 hypothetical protein [Haloferax alexandrinus]QIB79487.1 hypothetical protein G3A49_15800 [Haloferax alexandrinus]TVT94912.1 hypothetical protein FQA18_09295 [Haloferax volcanii]